MDRKTFIKKSLSAVALAIPAYAVLSCSSSDDSEPAAPPQNTEANCGTNGTSSSIGSNHGHSIVVSAADVTAGVDKTYNIQGSSAHMHSITVSSAQFADLQNNQQVTGTSTSDSGHTHSVTISCA
jgi:hypothetical protein